MAHHALRTAPSSRSSHRRSPLAGLRRHAARAAASSTCPPATATAAQNALLERWWTAFDDPVLTALIEEALANNLDLAARSRASRPRARSVLLAQSNLVSQRQPRAPAPSRSRQSQSTAQAAGFAIPRLATTTASALEMSYELDVWGKYRSGALAAANDLVASQYYRETVRITVAADVASAYFRLRAADALLVVLEDTRKTRTDTVQLQQDRFDGGIIGEYDLRQAEAELSAVDRRHRPRAAGDRSARIGDRDA